MNRIAQFYKVSFDQFKESWEDTFPETSSEEASPIDFELKPGETLKIPTGIRASMEEGWVLCIFPRSGLGFKYRLQMNNTVGIIDSDYYFSDNEGHIFVKLTNDTNENRTVTVKQGNGIVQGIFLPFGITRDDEEEGVRNGGFGSTTKIT